MDGPSLTPATSAERTLGTQDFLWLWFGAAIAITEIWAGGLPGLTTLGLAGGLVAILLGRAIGNGLMAAMAAVGAGTGLPTLVLTRPTFGIRGSYLPAFFNVLQLLGWTAWMIFVGAAYLDTLAGFAGLPRAADVPAMRWLWAALLGGLCAVWALAFIGRTWWRTVERAGGVLLLLLSIAMSVVVWTSYGGAQLWQAGGGSALGILRGMDLVVAMSVSWLPLVADYSRFARTRRGAAAGTFWGYFAGGSWMYAVGLLVALATASATPDQLVIEALAGQGIAWVVLAVALVLLSTVTTTFLDVYSAVVSAQNLWPSIGIRAGNVVVAVLGTLLALTLDAHSYEPFLIAIGAIFLPAFSVVLTDLYLLRRGAVDPGELDRRGGRYWYRGGFNPPALLAWLAGFLVYDWAQGFPALLTFWNTGANLALGLGLPGLVVNPPVTAFPWGASLPCIAASVAAYLLFSWLAGLTSGWQSTES
jgi:NCS1 family nucleobase:cation symporter-1